MSAERRYFAVAFAAVCLYAASWAIRLAVADQQWRSTDEPAQAEACNEFPQQTDFAIRCAGAQESQPGFWEKAIRLNAYETRAHFELAAQAEVRGDLAQAEWRLLQAANRDHTFEPAWALANFYFRSRRPEEFWRWLGVASLRAYGDRIPLFELGARFPHHTPERIRSLVPEEPPAWVQYLQFSARRQDWPEAAIAAKRLLDSRDPAGVLTLRAYADLLDQRRLSSQANAIRAQMAEFSQ